MTGWGSDVFIVAWLFIAMFWSQTPGRFPRRLVQPLSPLVRWLGLWHSWGMFAPSPMASDRRTFARVRMHDGTHHEMELPVATGFLAEARGVRHRKILNNLGRRHSPYLEYGLSKWVVRKARAEGFDPAMVSLVRITRPVEPLVEADRDPLGEREKIIYVTTFESVSPS